MIGAVLLAGAGWLLAPGAAYAAGFSCGADLKSDFNGDGYADAVVADPTATVGGQAGAGRVAVLYGDGDGRVGEGARGLVYQGHDDVGDVAEAGDRFGSALAVADLGCDGYTDLVVGAPYEDVNGNVDSGYVQVVWGAAGGLGTGQASRQYTQVDFGLPTKSGDQFGYAVDALEQVSPGFGSDAIALAIGVPGGDVGSHNDAGWVGVEFPDTNSGTSEDVLTQDSSQVPGVAETGDRFGAAVALGDFISSGATTGVAVGAPNEDIGSIIDAGNVTLIDDLAGFGGPGSLLDQDSPGVASLRETGDRFGYRLDAVQVGSTTRLAVGVPYEDIGSAGSAGLVQLFSSNGEAVTAGAGLTQDTAGVANAAETGDLFGEQLAWVRPGAGSAITRLAVGAPSEDGVGSNTGLVQVFPLTNLAAETTYTQDSSGIPGVAQAGDKFGGALAVVNGALEQVLLVGVPDDVDNSSGMVDVIPFGGGSPRAWVPGAGGVPGGANRFGGALTSSG